MVPFLGVDIFSDDMCIYYVQTTMCMVIMACKVGHLGCENASRKLWSYCFAFY